MNKVISRVAGLFIPCLLSLSLHAQQEQVPPPSPPFVERMPDHATWRVTYTPKQAPVPTASANGTNVAPVIPPQRTLKEVDGVKMDQNRQEIYLWSDHQTTEHWAYNGFLLLTEPNASEIHVLPSSSGSSVSGLPNYSKTDFPEFLWLSLENYKSIVTYQQHKCYSFQFQPQAPSYAKSVTYPPQQAWIDVKTKLPVALDDGDTLRVYTIKEVPQRELTLPPKFAEALQNYQKILAAAMGHPLKK